MLGRRKDAGVATDTAVEDQSERRMAPTEVRSAPAPTVHKRLGDLLLEERLISPEQLDAAIAIQKEKGGFLGQVLVQEGFVTQNQVASCLVKQCKIPHLSLMDYDISNDVIALVPQELCQRYRLLPIDKLGRILTVAMVDPLDLEALEQVRAHCPDLRIKPILCNWEHFQLVYVKVFGQEKGKGGQHVVSASSLGLSERAPVKAVEAEAAKPAAAPPEPPALEPAVTEIPAAAPAVDTTSADLAAVMRDTLREFLEVSRQPQPAASFSPEAMAAVLRDSLREALAEAPRAQVQLDATGMDGQALAVAMQETVREALQASNRQLQEREAKLTEIASSILQSVRENQRVLEQSVVREGVRRDLEDNGRERHASVIPFKRWQEGQTVEGLERRDSDSQVMDALYSEHPLEAMTFQNFFPGAANEFTYRISQAVAAHPGEDYNPFFLYGHVGIGKTHLINAMGNDILARHPEHRVGYVSASHFSRRVMEAAEARALDLFRENFAHWDVLILDDIQFLAGRVDAQEEFFHIFNVLHQQTRQIIIASDKPPDRLGLLEQRLISRFASGIVAELRAPEWETRIEILKHRVGQLENPPNIPPEVLSLVAMRVPNDVRKMTGALRKIVAYARLVGQEISVEMAAEIVKHLHLDNGEG